MKPKLTTLLLALCAIALTGCGEQKTQEEFQQYLDNRCDGYIKTVNYRGHSYILYSESGKGGGITHDPDCPCHQKGDEK